MPESRGTVNIDTDLCKGCGLCIVACPVNIIVLNTHCVNTKGYQPAIIKDPAACTGCGSCTLMCPDSVITVKRTIRERRNAHA